MRVPPSAAWDAAVERYLSDPPAADLSCPARRPRDDMMFDLHVKNILCCIEDFNNGIPEDDNAYKLVENSNLYPWLHA